MEPTFNKIFPKRCYKAEYICIALMIISSLSSCISQSIGNNLTTTLIVECPKYCSCKYEQLQQDLKISCQAYSNDRRTGSNTQRELNLSNGVKQLTISNLTLDFLSSFNILSQVLTSNLNELNLENVIIDPTYLFNSYIFLDLRNGLKNLKITKSKTERDGLKDDPISKEEFKMIHFTNLEHLESLTLCDNSPTLSNFILNSLPVVHHITIVNGAISHLDLGSLIHLNDLKSLNLSSNQIHSVPMGLGKYFQRLTSLDLSYNHIEHLQEEVFVGLSQLLQLNVSNNKIRYIDTEVFTPLESLEYIDISHNEMLQIFEPYFEENKNLLVLLMSNTWSEASFADEETAQRSLMEINRLLSTLQSVEILDFSDNHLTTIPESLTHMPNLQQINLRGNLWKCTCQDRWVLPWLSTPNMLIQDSNGTHAIWCSDSNNQKYEFSKAYVENDLNCTNSNILAKIPIKFFALIGKNALLRCHTQRHQSPLITWITPKQRKLASENTTEEDDNSAPQVFENGSLYITNITAAHFGLYICIASYEDVNVTHYVHLGMDTTIFLEIQYISIIVGWISSIGCLFAVLTVQLVRFLLTRCGIDCPKPSTPYNARRVRTFFENLEQHNNSQLDWLRDNYNMQAKRIKENCYGQVERIRESYTTQTKNLSEIREYGTQQLHTIRDQYFDQVRRVSSYSTQHLCRVRENYLFQRNRVCKFSSHQLLKLRETYKWQAQTLNKILENLPNLNFDTCRGMGACGRTESIYLNDMNCEFIPTELSHEPEDMKEVEKIEHISLLISAELGVDNAESEIMVVIVDTESHNYDQKFNAVELVEYM